ncbi:putative UDP-glucoronosyl and UDP-glucosyl transferase [Aspergillus heteromorphus CBS 117.55]|uniref:Putative UDP-glucoronosyl and UDP-glucosyl transferase n=1 Tax=Aspergillus heteromorphus CBS 117.55 TaxID=1448321 RepID=A0A317WY73_9EURO|nr:putative UDP-glucoronosyl and UDP-glucosyl transferase [Aspergillus heteromorphus CBS 117.55]PWY89150.1 putative UDP-glucoronosyl and UDP-glucosyl transferase [Aspergillus heteromorphus CBS 117.55]
MTVPPRKILLVVTTGGYTHAAPILELGRILSSRGHTITLATLNDQDDWLSSHPYITTTHLLGPGPTPAQYNAHYLRMRNWDMSQGLAASMPSKYLFDSFWPLTYHGLHSITSSPATRPDFIVADFFAVDAVRDIKIQFGIPIAVMSPTMPALMLPCSYIPGQPGFQIDGTVTSEDASLWLRIRNEMVVVWALREILGLWRWTKRMRRGEGVAYDLPALKKPDYIVLVNSFYGLEVARDLPPLAALVGPVLSEELSGLGKREEVFLEGRRKVMYIALGTHVIISNGDAVMIVQALLRLLAEGVLDGVIWAVGESGRQDLDLAYRFDTDAGAGITFDDLLSGRHGDFFFPFFAPQRAILDHEAVQIYFTHGGGSSANEGLYHGKRMLVMGIFSDQIANMARLVHAGVAESLDKFRFSAEEVYGKAKRVVEDLEGTYARNSLRLQRIACVASRRKYYAADLIEEVMYDDELRFGEGSEPRPMHLQTADVRMPAYKARNWDLMAVAAMALAGGLGAMGFFGRMLWRNRGVPTRAK